MNLSNLQIYRDKIKFFNYEFTGDVTKKELTPNIDLNVSQRYPEKDKEKHNAILGLKIKFQLKDGKKIKLKLETEIEVYFIGNPKLKEKEFRELVIKSGIINLFQIARAKIVAISSNFGFVSPIYIPMLNINDIIEEELKKALKDL